MPRRRRSQRSCSSRPSCCCWRSICCNAGCSDARVAEMHGTLTPPLPGARPRLGARSEPAAVRIVLTLVALAFLVLLIGLPLIGVFVEALRRGVDVYVAALTEPVALAA